MKNFKGKRLLLLVAIMLTFAFMSTNLAFAANANLKSLEVQIKPEYDKEKTVFMMLTGELDQAASSSDKLTIYTPSTIIQDTSLHFCALDASGQHQCQTYDKATVGNLFKFDLPMPQNTFQIEGYFESIKDNGGKKTLDYTFKAGQDIDELTISLTHPKGATNYKTSPPAQSTANDNNGLKNHGYSFDNVKKGKEYKFNISYTKKGWDVSLERSGMGAAASSKSTGQSGSGTSALTILIAFIVAIALSAVIFTFFSKRSSEGTSRKQAPVPPKGKSRFCANCGTRLQGGAKFCPNCGSKTK
ncbi:MAG: zinc ribbon domain-containing protein [Actinobacteria bacterium]|nr:MAG: zinc ribbon domain-containing protein [Actinomycetota bacterium]